MLIDPPWLPSASQATRLISAIVFVPAANQGSDLVVVGKLPGEVYVSNQHTKHELFTTSTNLKHYMTRLILV